MEPFSIRCETCAARLKVTNPSAVGQKLACPKCGSMILVTAPEGWQPPTESSDDVTSANSSGEFDDIERILEQSPQPKSSPSPQRSPTKSVNPKTRQATQASSPPILPNESWTAESTQKKQRTILIVAGLVGAIVVAGAIISAIFVGQNRPDPNPAVAESDQELDNAQPSQTVEETATTNTADPKPETADPTAIKPVEQTTTDDVDDKPVAETAESPEEAVDTMDAASDSNETTVTEPETDTTEQDSQPSPFSSDLDDFLNQPSTSIDEFKTEFDDLSDALESNGSSLFEINQFSSLQFNQRRIGLPKYFIPQPEPFDPKNYQRMFDPVKGVQYIDHNFLQVIEEVTNITGIPISFDTENLFNAELDYGFKLQDYQNTEIDFKGLLQTSLQQSGYDLVVKYKPGSPALISISDVDVPRSAKIALPKLEKIKSENFASLIMQMVAPGSWNQHPELHAITIDGPHLQVKHLPSAIEKVRQFVQKWDTAIKVKRQELPLAELETRWGLSAAARSIESNLELKKDLTILQFALRIQEISDVNLLINFQSLMPLGWTPKTKIPQGFSEANIEDALDEVAHSLNVTYRAIKANTFELMSKQRMQDLTEVEFHNCSKILAGKLTSQQLNEVVRQSLQSANQLNGSTRAYFEPEIECFIVVGPQNVQKLVSSVLQRLESPPPSP